MKIKFFRIIKTNVNYQIAAQDLDNATLQKQIVDILRLLKAIKEGLSPKDVKTTGFKVWYELYKNKEGILDLEELLRHYFQEFGYRYGVDKLMENEHYIKYNNIGTFGDKLETEWVNKQKPKKILCFVNEDLTHFEGEGVCRANRDLLNRIVQSQRCSAWRRRKAPDWVEKNKKIFS